MMTSPNGTPTSGGGLTIIWLALTSLLLLATAVLHSIFVLPVYMALQASWGADFSLPARIAFEIARYGVVVGGLGGAVFGLYVWYRKEPGRRERLITALAASALFLTLYLALMSCAYVDVAISVPARMPATGTPPPAPAPVP